MKHRPVREADAFRGFDDDGFWAAACLAVNDDGEERNDDEDGGCNAAACRGGGCGSACRDCQRCHDRSPPAEAAGLPASCGCLGRVWAIFAGSRQMTRMICALHLREAKAFPESCSPLVACMHHDGLACCTGFMDQC
jgi:hypothetical protein